MEKKQCLVLLSNGLDSRLVVKIMQEQGFDVTAVFFKMAFSKNVEDEVKEFAKEQKIKLKIIDLTKEEFLQDYLEMVKKPKFSRGTGVNPCIDCKIFIFKRAREFADLKGIDLIVAGDVLGERPMSQMKKSLKIVEEESGLKGRLLRPLSAKHLDETNSEKNKLVDREKLYEIQGRQRKGQIALAKKFRMKYPSPGGGCLMCEKSLKNRFKFLLKRGLSDEETALVGIGRHFLVDTCWVVIGRNLTENKIIVGLKKGEKIISKSPGPSAIILDECADKTINKVEKLIKSYSKEGSEKDRKKFEEDKI